MKTKIISIAALISMAFMVNAETGKKIVKSEEVEIIIDNEGDNRTKKIIINGKQLSAQEIKEFEASGKMETLHRDHSGENGKVIKIIKQHTGDSSGKHLKWITKGDADEENIEVEINTEDGKVTEKIIVNGKELSVDEIKEFKASGKMKVIHLGDDMQGLDGHQMMFIKSDSDDMDIDVEVIMNKLGQLHESHDGKSIELIEKHFIVDSDAGATLGIMANVKDGGWYLSKVIEESGAKDAGMAVGDMVTSIGGVDLTKSSGAESRNLQELPKFDAGEMVVVVLERNGESIELAVEARELNSDHIVMDIHEDAGNHIEWIEKLADSDAFDLSQKVKVMVFDSKGGNFKLNEDDIHMVFPENLKDMNIFISDGSSTSKLLGKHHEMSALSDDLSQYFHTKGGVLVLHVDAANAFALKDGDVIKSINGHAVNSPKDVVKQLINSDDENKIKLKVIRHKKNKTLKYKNRR